jgi:tRNA pseudouridine32 synthase/23S rRNA pseudouridine746 synthase
VTNQSNTCAPTAALTKALSIATGTTPPAEEKAPHIVPFCKEQVEILLEDEHLLLVNKPSGLLSVPGKHPANHDCLISRLQLDYPQARMAHRLDLDTSGIMVVALNADCHRALNRLFSDRLVSKQYQAIVYGTPEQPEGDIELPLICDWPNRPKQKVDFEEGKKSLTHYQLISQLMKPPTSPLIDQQADRSRLLLTPITGRSHQLRVHLAEIGHPILGCEFYAHEKAFTMAERLQLHATDLQFIHPMTGEKINGHSRCPF